MAGRFQKTGKELPARGQKSIGVALYDAQKGGVFEIALRFDKDAYRAVHAVQIGSRVYVLHAFQKKSRPGIAMPRPDVEVIEQRYRQALKMEKES